MRRITLGLGLLLLPLLLPPTLAHAHEVEVSYSGIPRLRFGISLGERTQLTLGAYGGLFRYGDGFVGGRFSQVYSDFGAGGELGLKHYFRQPRDGAIVPHVRLEGSYGAARRRNNAYVEWGRVFSGRAALGLTYFPRAAIGIGAEAILGYTEHRFARDRLGSGGLGAALLLTFRLGSDTAVARAPESFPPPPPPASYDSDPPSARSFEPATPVAALRAPPTPPIVSTEPSEQTFPNDAADGASTSVEANAVEGAARLASPASLEP